MALAGMLFVSLAWVVIWPFWPSRARLLDLGKIVDYSWWAFGVWSLGLAIWLVSLWMLLPVVRGTTWTTAPVPLNLMCVLLLAAFAAMYPVSAIDVYIYSARSYLFTHYGENPNAVQPILHWDSDPFVHFASKEWSDNLSPYGPLWNLISAPITWLSDDNIGGAIAGYKLLSALSIAVIAVLIYSMVRRSNPEWAVPATLFWIWNPFVLWDGLANAHNDVVMLVPIMLAMWCWQRRHDGWVMPLLVTSILIKYVAVLLIPLAGIALLSRYRATSDRIRLAMQGLLASVAIAVLSMAPFFDPQSVWKSFNEQGARFGATPAWAATQLWHLVTGKTADMDLVRLIATGIVAVIVLGLCAMVWRQPELLPSACFEALFAFCLIASTNQRPWYTLWLVPLAAVSIPGFRWIRAGVWCVSSMLGYIAQIYLWYVWDFDRFGSTPYRMLLVLIIFGPVIVGLAIEDIVAHSGSKQRRRVDPRGAVLES